MPRTATAGSLAKLLDQSSRPLYVVDAERRIVYCNASLATWLALEPDRIIGREVEYHSEAAGNSNPKSDSEAPLTDLCPPPRALFGEPCVGTISRLAHDSRLVHRQAEFIPLSLAMTKTTREPRAEAANAVVVLLAYDDLTPEALSSRLTKSPSDPQSDELHRTIRQFRRAQASAYALESLLGDSAAMRKVRAQIAAAAASSANVLLCGPTGSGRRHIARAIHYHTTPDTMTKLVPLDCRILNEDLRSTVLDGLRGSTGHGRQPPTLLLEDLQHLAPPYQGHLLSMLQENALRVRVIATLAVAPPSRGGREVPDVTTTHPMDPALIDALSTITIKIPPLIDRMDDLPILAQSFLESCNRGTGKQIGSVRPEALDLLALYSWPRELIELREVIAAAHRACNFHEIGPSDLPPVVHHAAQAASRIRRQPERIDLDALLAAIEKEVVQRALSQAGGNKSAAAELLGMTRPRLYRRMIQLGLISEPAAEDPPGPEFVEQDPADQTP